MLDYEYSRFNVKNSYELSRKYSAYIEMKEEQKKKRQEVGMTKDFSGLVQLAKERGYKNPAFWASKVMQYRRNKNNHSTMKLYLIRHWALKSKKKVKIVYTQK